MRSSGFRGNISLMDLHADIAIDTPAPPTDVLPLEFSFGVRPVGRLMLLGQVPTLDPFRAVFADNRLWMRWAEPDRDDAQIEIASASMDAPSSSARVIARARVPDRWGAWALFRIAQVQGMVDLWLAGPTAADGSSPEVVRLPVYADVSQAEPGLPLLCHGSGSCGSSLRRRSPTRAR